MIYLSSNAFNKLSGYQSANYFKNNNIYNIELSGGLYDENYLSNLKIINKEMNLKIHNYFPVPKVPFVFNLASLNKEIVKRSIDHAIKSIKLASNLGLKDYSFHAGFLLDPQVNQLGKIIDGRKLYNREESTNMFIKNLGIIFEYSQKYNINLLIENNVLSKKNYNQFNCNPFLMADCENTELILNSISNKIKLLLDVAHLKVSSNILQFNKFKFIEKFKNRIGAIHLSDNDGNSDTNDCINDKSWFCDIFRKLNININNYDFTLEINNENIKVLKNQIVILKKNIPDPI